MFSCTSNAWSPRIVPGRAGHRPEGLDGPRALDHHGDERPGGDEIDQRSVERLANMLGVVRLSGTAPQGTQFQRHDPQALPLESRYHIADQTSAHSVGLDQDQATFRQRTTLLTDSDQPPTRRHGSSEEGPRESEPTGARGAGLATARRGWQA